VATVRLNLRQRIALAFALVCTAVVAALGITLRNASEEMEEALVEQLVSEEVDHLIARYRANPDTLLAAGPNLQYFVVRSTADEKKLPDIVRRLTPGNYDIGQGRNERHIAVRTASDVRFVVIYDAGPHEVREEEFRNLLILSIITAVVASLLLGYWLSGMLTRQFRELAHRVTRLAPDETQVPLADPQQDAEVAVLARALDDYQNRITTVLAREQEFTANASHELRTPLTAIRTSCELLLDDTSLPERARQRISAIDAAATRMGEQVQALLFLAREQPLGRIEPVSLAECVRDVIEPLKPEFDAKGLRLDVAVDPGAVCELDAQAVHTVLSNLLRNALRHTDRGFIRVAYAAPRLTITDSGSGIDPQELPRLFERFYRGGAEAGRFGLGLAIVKRICDHYRWRIEVASTPGSGSAFTIVFP
jgi:signal transduction histidine kinase